MSGRLRRYLGNALWHVAVNEVAASRLAPRQVRFALYRTFGMRFQDVRLLPGCFFASREIAIGRGSLVNHDCVFDNQAPIQIGSDCGIGMQVMFCTTTHGIGPHARRTGEEERRGIRVGDGCWIGVRAVVLPGVTIGSGCIIAAGAVVVDDCEPDGLYAGVPARRVRDLPGGPVAATPEDAAPA
ncbi:MAG: acyltransferase [Actinomycetota bacterium]|nr:acyltransferase [Actinomycetota bacterium]